LTAPSGNISPISKLSGIALLLCLAWPLAACSDPQAKPPLTFVQNIQLPRDTSTPSVDLLALDPRSGRLYAPHGSNDALDIIDIKAGRLAGSVPHLAGIKGIAVTSDPDLVFTSNGGDGTVAVVDATRLEVVKTIHVGGKPDAIEYDPIHDAVVVSLGPTKDVVFIDRTTYKELGRVTLPGQPELMTVDRQAGRIFVAIHDRDEVVVIDGGTLAITFTYRGCDIKAPTGIAYDPDQGRLFVAGTKQLNILDIVLGRCLGVVDLASGTDQIAFNAHTHHVYAANASSKNVSIVDSPTMKPLGIVGTGRDAGTIATDPTTDRVYVAVARAGIIAVYHDP
jgi:DNA-binding beta-propeller fold protein YncE